MRKPCENRCQPGVGLGPEWGVYDIELREADGADVLVRLLWMSVEHPAETPTIHEIIMRLFVPKYEQARHHFDEVSQQNDIDATIPPGYFTQSTLRYIINEYADSGNEG